MQRCEGGDLVHLVEHLLLLLVTMLDQDGTVGRPAVDNSVRNEADLVDALFSQHLVARDVAENPAEELLVALSVDLAIARLGELRKG